MEELLISKQKSTEQMIEIPTLSFDMSSSSEETELSSGTPSPIQSVRALPVHTVKSMVRTMKSELRSIFSGTTPCCRHEAFKKGGAAKSRLSMQVSFGVFTGDQEEAIGNVLVNMFCSSPRRSKYFDYTMKVLLPETM